MRNLFLNIMFLFTFCPVFSENIALLIGVGKYAPESGWRDISSLNDLEILRKHLPATFKINALENANATYNNIVASLNSLDNQLSPGDTVLIHFSGHGQQMISEDSNEPDGLDEALVPYDALNKKSPVYDGSHHIRDNELGVIIRKLRKKLGDGGLLVVTVDACFSDSMDKGDESTDVIYRGGAEIFGFEDLDDEQKNVIMKNRKHEDNDIVDINLADASDVIVISACKTFQRNREIVEDGVGYGPLSYAMAMSFIEEDFSNIKVWLNRVLDIMEKVAFFQDPQIRTTLDYEENDSLLSNTSNSAISEDTNGQQFFWMIIAVLFIFIFIFIIYGRRKKNK